MLTQRTTSAPYLLECTNVYWNGIPDKWSPEQIFEIMSWKLASLPTEICQLNQEERNKSLKINSISNAIEENCKTTQTSVEIFSVNSPLLSKVAKLSLQEKKWIMTITIEVTSRQQHLCY